MHYGWSQRSSNLQMWLTWFIELIVSSEVFSWASKLYYFEIIKNIFASVMMIRPVYEFDVQVSTFEKTTISLAIEIKLYHNNCIIFMCYSLDGSSWFALYMKTFIARWSFGSRRYLIIIISLGFYIGNYENRNASRTLRIGG